MNTSDAGVLLIERFEGFSSVQYRDSVGVPTIGFGTTAADISPLPLRCTVAEATGWLRSKLASKYEPAVNALGVPLNQNQFDALVSLAYNCGPGVMGWQIGRDLRARNYGAAAEDFMHYVYAGGHVLQGLVNRRRAEQQLFLSAPAPTPKPPDPFAIFDTHWIRHGGVKIQERQTAQQTEGALQHAGQYKAYLQHVLRPRVQWFRDECYRAAAKSHPRDWTKNHRGERWQAFDKYLKRIDAIH